MPISHFLLILLVIFIWGCNFIFLKFSLNEVSPLLLCAVRFFLASFPAILFIKPPKASFKLVVLYGILMFGMQFSFLFLGMNLGMAPGLSSILMQIQIFFSIFFAAIFLGEIPGLWQILGAVFSFGGIGIIAMHLDKTASFSGFLLIIAAAASWGLGNLVAKRIGRVNMISLVVWGSFVACLPLFLLSLLFEGPGAIVKSTHQLSWLGGASIFYVVYCSTWIGYGVWNWLINRYAVATIVPFTLLVPIVAMLSSALVLGESFQLWKLISGLLVIMGLLINFLGSRLVKLFIK